MKMTKTLKDFFEVYSPKAKGEKRFVDKHIIIKHPDANGNDDEVFKAKKVKSVERTPNHGYNPGEDEKVYEELEESMKPYVSSHHDKMRGYKVAEVLNHKGDVVKSFNTNKHGEDYMKMAIAHLKKNYNSLKENEELNSVVEGIRSYYAELDEEISDEEVYTLAEELINEISRETKKSYVRAADKDVGKRLKSAETQKDYDKIYNRERNMEKASNSIKGHLANYKMKPVQGLYTHVHFEHPDGSFAQIHSSGKGPWIHQDKNGKRTEHKDTEALIQHVNKLHEEVEQIDELSKNTLADYVRAANDENASSLLKGFGSMHRTKKDSKYVQRTKGIDRALTKLTKEDAVNSFFEKYQIDKPESISDEERLVEKLEPFLSESDISRLLFFYSNLDEDNKQLMLNHIEDEESVNDVMNFMIEHLDEIGDEDGN